MQHNSQRIQNEDFSTVVIRQWTETVESIEQNPLPDPDRWVWEHLTGAPSGFVLVSTHATTAVIGTTIVHTVFATFQKDGSPAYSNKDRCRDQGHRYDKVPGGYEQCFYCNDLRKAEENN